MRGTLADLAAAAAAGDIAARGECVVVVGDARRCRPAEAGRPG